MAKDPWSENVPREVVICRADKILTRPPTQKELIKTAESAYRRGYQQGAHQALCAALAGEPLVYLLHEWVGCRLHDWRYSKDRVSGNPPPEPHAPKKARKV